MCLDLFLGRVWGDDRKDTNGEVRDGGNKKGEGWKGLKGEHIAKVKVGKSRLHRGPAIVVFTEILPPRTLPR